MVPRIRAGENLSDRLESLIQNSNAFIVMRGAHGTLNELTTIIEEEDLRHESGKADNQTKFCSRPIIIADPSGYTEDLLNYIFGKKITKFKNSLDTNILDQIYFLPKDSYITSRETPLMATVSLSEKGKEYMAGILEAYSNGDSETICNLGVKTLRNAIGNSYSRVKE